MYDEIERKDDYPHIYLLICRGRHWAVVEIDCVAHQCVTPLPVRKTPGRYNFVGGTGRAAIAAAAVWVTEARARRLFARCGSDAPTAQWIIDAEADEAR